MRLRMMKSVRPRSGVLIAKFQVLLQMIEEPKMTSIFETPCIQLFEKRGKLNVVTAKERDR